MWALDNGYEMIVIDKDNPTLGQSSHPHFHYHYMSAIYRLSILCAIYVSYIVYDGRLARP